jgi:hypothetical protein
MEGQVLYALRSRQNLTSTLRCPAIVLYKEKEMAFSKSRFECKRRKKKANATT